VDEFNRPLYGDVFGLYTQYQKQLQTAIEASHLTTPAERTLWGELEPEQFVEESESEAESESPVESVPSGTRTPSGMATPSGLASVSTTAGMATPQVIELRKEKDDAPKHLYTVLQQRDNAISGLMGSQHTYDVGKKRRFTNAPSDSVDVALNPDELDNLPSVVEQKFQQARSAEMPKHESFSDLVSDHIDKSTKKRKLDSEKDKKKKDFKF
jgi:splicing factor 3B subunit 2